MAYSPGTPDYRLDPYRATKRSSKTTDGAHSRFPSDSSTSRLTDAAVPFPRQKQEFFVDYQDDPYARQTMARESDRANSYLPYSHHPRDPFAPVAPIYLEGSPSLLTSLHNEGGAGSMLQDTIPMEWAEGQQKPPVETQQQRHQQQSKLTNIDPLPFHAKKKRRCCRLGRRTIAFIVVLTAAVIAVIWYFVWPRVPQLTLVDADMTYPATVGPRKAVRAYNASWTVEFAVDNSQNWVPTRIDSLDVVVYNRPTGVAFGHGQTGPLVLAPRTSKETVTLLMDISYESTSETDPTWDNLYNACGVQESNVSPVVQPQETLDVEFHVAVHIAKIAWTTTRIVTPPLGIECPR